MMNWVPGAQGGKAWYCAEVRRSPGPFDITECEKIKEASAHRVYARLVGHERGDLPPRGPYAAWLGAVACLLAFVQSASARCGALWVLRIQFLMHRESTCIAAAFCA